ncbi:lantibiotic dehydratase [Streptomyces sp. NBC_01803]|uniref:lantibiotic dehydratase n=1 Tax=Streptomyces sp. NBC_01803 TaxID=2975946 RepID=UPI002DD80C91|nr:lantibiotic dehydratase [Streptomyces sp. NBC_01803]WSA43698.1 lantibiotic dehydratase [Streptomyces sp. NBC_01803]
MPFDLDLAGPGGPARGRAWLTALWQRAEIREALGAASPVLCRQIEEIAAGKQPDARRVRKSVLSLVSYLLRWQGRPTPFGLFAGVAPVSLGQAPRVAWGGDHRTVVRADAAWLADIIARLHRCRPLLEHLAVVASNAGQVRGGRYVVPGAASDVHGHQLAPLEVSVRYTRPVAAALDAARSPIPYRELRALLADRFPAAGPEKVDTLLGDLVDQHVLISSLRPPMTGMDALGHVCTALEAADARSIPGVADLAGQLYAIRDELAERPAARWSGTAGLVKRMRALSNAAPVPLVADTTVDCDVQLPEFVAREAERAVGVLSRLSPYPVGYPQWRDYHGRFRARYGAGAVVPVRDLVADSGLGLPAGYLDSAWQRAPQQLTERDGTLLALVQQAMLDDREEIVLTERLVCALAAGQDAEPLPVPRAEVAAEIHAPSLDALARGAFRLVIAGTPRPGSSMAGRFAHLLPAQEQARLAETYRAADPEATAAQLSFAPRRRRSENIARTPQLLPHVIALAEHRAPHPGDIPLADLAVIADERHFHLVRLSTGRRVEPRVLHALEAGVQTPPLARFLAEITTARCAVYKSFDFGAATHLPYLPRVRYQRTILAAARWLLTAAELPHPRAEMPAWEAAFEAWRTTRRVPDHVSLTEHGQRLPLDLTHPVHRLLLRTRLNSTQRLELREAPTPKDVGWLGRAHEVLLPLTLAAPARSGPAPAPIPPQAVQADAGHLPGRSPILHAHLHGHPARFDEILTDHLPRLISDFDQPPRWWFGRRRALPRPDADQHLALSIRLPEPSAYGPAAELLHTWTRHLRGQGLAAHATLATYQPQPGRYGHGPTMDAAQAVFAADSAAALTQIRMAALGQVHPQALAAASLIDLAGSFTEAVDDGLTWLVEHLPQQHGPLDRTLRDQALRLADPHGAWAALRAEPGGMNVVRAWRVRAAALTVYREHLAAQRDPLPVLKGLIHLHHVRALGIDQDLERITGRLARACALREITRSRA